MPINAASTKSHLIQHRDGLRVGIDIWTREKPARNTKSTFYREWASVSCTHRHHQPTFQADVEEYIGGPEGDVEGPLKAFQDAIAYVVMSCSGMTLLNR